MLIRKLLNFLVISLFIFSFSCKQKEQSVRIFFTGDMLLDRGVRTQVEKKGAASLFRNVKPFFSEADFVVANLECPVTKRVSPVHKKYVFRAEPEWLSAVREAEITHLIMANNHTYDQGRSGLEDTYQNLLKNNLTPIGYGNNQRSACEPVILEKNGIRAAVFSSILLPLENWPYLPDTSGICQATVKDLANKISDYKTSFPYDKVIVVLHWGAEFQTSPSIEQVKQAHLLIDAGADAIIGHHPHVIQEMRVYRHKPVFYSLGNFVFDQKLPAAQLGQLAEIEIDRSGEVKYKAITIKITDCTPILILE